MCAKYENNQKKSPIIAFFLAWLIPGMGHFYYKKRMKGFLFFISIISMYLIGIFIGGEVLWYDITILDILGFIVKLFCGIICVITVIVRPLYDNTAMYYNIGTAFILIAGALNMLVIVDLYEEIRGKEKNAD